MNKKIAIIGAGGHGKVVGEIALLNQYEIIDFFDDRVNEIKEFPFTVIDTFDNLKERLGYYNAFFVAIGDNKIRGDKIIWLFSGRSVTICPNFCAPKTLYFGCPIELPGISCVK